MHMENRRQPYSAILTGATDSNPLFRLGIATVLLIILLILFINAGFWQLGRAAEKEELEESFRTGAGMELLQTPIDDEAADDSRYRRLQLEGRFEPDKQILLDNIVHGGINGYEVLTPFRTHDVTIMVNRGWIRANPDRRIVPDISVDDSERSVTGIVNKFSEPGIRFAAEFPDDAPWPRRMLYPDRTTISKALNTPVESYQLLLVENQPDGYTRKWKVLQVNPGTNYGYALQWFSFAVLAIIFYTILFVHWQREHGSLFTVFMNRRKGSS
jgi:surfeit locus 1 family protein